MRFHKGKFSILLWCCDHGITTCHSLRQPEFVGHGHSSQTQKPFGQLIGMKLKERSNLFYSLETTENCLSYSKLVLLPWTCREGGENWSMLGQSQSLSGYLQHFIHEMANTAYTFLSRLLSMNWKVRTMWKWGEQSSGIRKSTTSIQNLRCLDTPHYYSRFLAHVAFCNEIVFHSLGLFIYTSFRISCLIPFRNRKGRKIYFLFKHLALGTGAVTID